MYPGREAKKSCEALSDQPEIGAFVSVVDDIIQPISEPEPRQTWLRTRKRMCVQTLCKEHVVKLLRSAIRNKNTVTVAGKVHQSSSLDDLYNDGTVYVKERLAYALVDQFGREQYSTLTIATTRHIPGLALWNVRK